MMSDDEIKWAMENTPTEGTESDELDNVAKGKVTVDL